MNLFNPFEQFEIMLIIPVFSSKNPIKFLKFLLIGFFIILIYSFVIYQSPFLILLTIIFFSIIPCLHFLSFFPIGKVSNKSKLLIDNILNLLYLIGFLETTYFYYNFLNNYLTLKIYKIYIVFISVWFLSYILMAKYVLYLKINNIIIPWYIILFYLVASFGLLIRGLTSFSWSVIPIIFYYYPRYGRLLCPPLETESDIPSNSGVSSGGNNYGGFFPRHYHNHHHNYFHPPMPPKSNFYRNCGLLVGTAGVCLSSFACYTYHKSANAAVAAAVEARRQADAAVRQADAAALSSGAISKEVYYSRHPGDRPKE